jgi:hypothetical protein
MELCFTPNCHELVRKSDPCPLCPGSVALMNTRSSNLTTRICAICVTRE